MHIFIVRHGTTTAIEENIIQGVMDSPLSVDGKKEVRKTSRELSSVPFGSAFSSPLGRARETIEILLEPHGIKPVYLDSLREVDFGGLEGKKYFRPPSGELKWFHRVVLALRSIYAQITGEPLCIVRHRAEESWEIIKKTANFGPVLVVSHGVILKYFVNHILSEGNFRRIQHLELFHDGITELKIHCSGEVEILRLNDVSHLDG